MCRESQSIAVCQSLPARARARSINDSHQSCTAPDWTSLEHMSHSGTVTLIGPSRSGHMSPDWTAPLIQNMMTACRRVIPCEKKPSQFLASRGTENKCNSGSNIMQVKCNDYWHFKNLHVTTLLTDYSCQLIVYFLCLFTTSLRIFSLQASWRGQRSNWQILAWPLKSRETSRHGSVS